MGRKYDRRFRSTIMSHLAMEVFHVSDLSRHFSDELRAPRDVERNAQLILQPIEADQIQVLGFRDIHRIWPSIGLKDLKDESHASRNSFTLLSLRRTFLNAWRRGVLCSSESRIGVSRKFSPVLWGLSQPEAIKSFRRPVRELASVPKWDLCEWKESFEVEIWSCERRYDKRDDVEPFKNSESLAKAWFPMSAAASRCEGPAISVRRGYTHSTGFILRREAHSRRVKSRETPQFQSCC